MYTATINKNDNLEQIHDFISKNSFGILVSQVNSKLWGTHIPLELEKNPEGKDVLVGHIARANPQWKNLEDNSEILVIFQGSHTYISSSWYDHENVPTWNYIAVHVYGKIRIIEGDRLVNVLKNIVDKYEKGSEKPVSVEKMSEKFLTQQIKGIVGFEIEIGEIQATYKLSQNRDAKNHENIVNELEKKADPNAHAIAQEMKIHQKNI
jgi:transcriptional regulator